MGLDDLVPQKVFHWFDEICKIPHGSGNVTMISDYLVAFAKQRGLTYFQDDTKNVIIKKPASTGYEDELTVMIQGHMDMVAVKKPGFSKDLKTEGLDVKIDGDKIYAEGTSLGGDDGIAVAYALAILDDDTLKHPALEVIITVDEEVGMNGASAIDLSHCKGTRMLNLDSEEEGIFLTSCAGGARVNCHFPIPGEKKSGEIYRISIEGLKGGHSGEVIDQERGNANCIMARLLHEITETLPVYLVSLDGGLADNAIPRRCVAELLVGVEEEVILKEIIDDVEKDISRELAVKDPDFQITVISEGEKEVICANKKASQKAANTILAMPNGVIGMSADVKGLVETSLNLGIIQYQGEDGILKCSFSVRSSINSAKKSLIEKLSAITELGQGTVTVTGDYPGWAYRVDSPLREKMVALYKDMYGVEPKLMAIHAGLECGILASKVRNLDCISFGPNMENIHTTEEKLSISSTQRVWDFVVALLAKKG